MVPPWARSIRFRLAGLYTLVVFGLAVLVVGSIYFAFSRSLKGEPVTDELLVRRVTSERGVAIYLDEASVEDLERYASQQALARLRTMSLIALAVLFPLSLGVGWVVAGRVLRPVGEITRVARDIQGSDLSRRIHLEGPDDELKRLADTFDGMLGRIEGAVEDQRRFIQDISHELRNPLATMATSIDVALSDPKADTRSLRETVKVVRRSVDRLTRSVSDLTRFARRELPDTATRAVRLGALAHEVIEEYRVPAEARGLHLEHIGGTGPTVRADRGALHSAVGNLAGNA
ncbi:MAG: histidine kinase, partial [Actinobacteria bacterium]|nr:histidine kinase [Actinomycetota bacterium]